MEQADQPVERAGRLSGRRGHPGTGDRPGHADPQFAAAHGYPFRRHGDLRSADRRRVPGGVGADGESQRPAMGQRRLRGNRFGEVRPAGAWHALGAALRHRPGRRAQGHRGGPGSAGPVRARGVRDAAACRLRRGVPGGVARADGHPAAAEAAGVLRPGGRGRADPARADPGRVGAPLHQAAQRRRTRHLRPPVDGVRTAEDVGGAAVSGAAHAARGRLRRLLRRRGRPVAPGDGVQALHGADATIAWPVLRRHARAARHHRRGGRPDLREAGSLRQFRLPRKPFAVVRLAGVLLVVVQAASPGGVLCGAAARTADGLLLAAVAGGRRPQARGDSAGPRRQRQPGARDAGKRRHGGAAGPWQCPPHRRRVGRADRRGAKGQRAVRILCWI